MARNVPWIQAMMKQPGRRTDGLILLSTSVHPRLHFFEDGHIVAFLIQNRGYFVKVKEIKGLRGDVACHVAQVIPQIDKRANVIGRIGEIDHFWMETS